jgi:hypothetical protein
MDRIGPIEPDADRDISDKAIKLFETLLYHWANCECPRKAGLHAECDHCQIANAVEWELHHELKLKPWEWPSVREPDADDEEPRSNYREAEERYLALKVAALEHKRGLLRAFLKAHPDQRRGEAFVYQQIGPARFCPVRREEGMGPDNGWLSTSDL